MIEIIKWEEALSKCTYDEKVGIRIAKLAGNDEFSTFITIIDPNKYVNPHYHQYGDEHYHIIKGSGELRLKNLESGFEDIHLVQSNQSFTVPENTLHQLINVGSEPLILMFSCPLNHLEADRYFL